MRIGFAVSGIILTILLILAGLQDVSREWETFQSEYKELSYNLITDEKLRSALLRMEEEIKQDYLPALGRIDRCRTCHLGIENPAMDKAPQPHALHPGDYLKNHPSAHFGCTICHKGQGLATTVEEAHAKNIKFWEEPMLSKPFIEASCEQCHKGVEVANAPMLNAGRKIFETKGCAGCHKVYGKGGTLGPELTNLGSASIYLKHPLKENIERYAEKTSGDLNLAYIIESIERPAAQPPDTTMPDYNFSEWEIIALATYVKSLTDKELPANYRHKETYRKPEPNGKELFTMYCSACHGAKGEGGLRIGRMGTALNNDDFLALASSEFLQGVIRNGRNSHNKVMPAWRSTAGGLSEGEIEKLVEFILSWKNPPPDFAAVLAANGDADEGDGIYRRNCADCHGSHREGKIGPSLVSPEFLQIASRRFFYETLTKGRPGTAMPAWRNLSTEQIKSLILFLETYDKPFTPSSQVSSKGDPSLGRKIFQSRCASCHGFKGEAGIAPSLNSPEFAALASDEFLIKTVVNGRKDSGMPAWSQLGANELSGVIAYIKTLARPVSFATFHTTTGNRQSGSDLFGRICAKCHGVSGEGGTGPAIASRDFLDAASDRFLFGTIKFGRSGTEMRPMGDLAGTLVNLSDSEISDIIAYLRTSREISLGAQTIRGSVDAGREWYLRVCHKCHGESGGGGTGPALANPYFLSAATDGFLQATMALGRSGTEMRPVTKFSGGIVEFERRTVNDIIAYLREESGNYGTPKMNVQTAFGSIWSGDEWFGRICAKCHGSDGRGTDAAPGLNDPIFLSYASDGFLQGTIIRGRMHTGMRAFGLHGDGIAGLTAREITDITTFIRSWVNPLFFGAAEIKKTKEFEKN